MAQNMDPNIITPNLEVTVGGIGLAGTRLPAGAELPVSAALSVRHPSDGYRSGAESRLPCHFRLPGKEGGLYERKHVVMGTWRLFITHLAGWLINVRYAPFRPARQKTIFQVS
jgi:hypothetical protein